MKRGIVLLALVVLFPAQAWAQWDLKAGSFFPAESEPKNSLGDTWAIVGIGWRLQGLPFAELGLELDWMRKSGGIPEENWRLDVFPVLLTYRFAGGPYQWTAGLGAYHIRLRRTPTETAPSQGQAFVGSSTTETRTRVGGFLGVRYALVGFYTEIRYQFVDTGIPGLGELNGVQVLVGLQF